MYTPKQVHDNARSVGEVKVALPVGRLAVLAIAAGAYISLGALLSVIIGFGCPGLTDANPGLQRLLSGLTFPIGLLLIVVLGGELFTGNNAILMPGLVARRFSMLATLRNWTLVWLFNFVGAPAFIAALVHATGLLVPEPWHSAIANVATAKVSMSWWTVFFKAVGANWCVCLAVWLALTAKTLTAKALGCWIPVMAFVALGFEHCIANMFFIPAGMLAGADITTAQMFTANLIPATLGNIVGGALLVGALNSYIHRDR